MRHRKYGTMARVETRPEAEAARDALRAQGYTGALMIASPTPRNPNFRVRSQIEVKDFTERPSAKRRTLDHWFEGFRDDSKDPGAAPYIARRKSREQGSRQRPEMEALGFIAADGTPLVAHITGPFEFKGSHVKEREVAQAFGMMRLYLLSGREPWPIVWNRNDDVFEDMKALAALDGIAILNVEEFKALHGLA